MIDPDNDRTKALEKLYRLRRSSVPHRKKWRNAGYFDVPGAVMRELAEHNLCETRKLSGSSPQEYRPK